MGFSTLGSFAAFVATDFLATSLPFVFVAVFEAGLSAAAFFAAAVFLGAASAGSYRGTLVRNERRVDSRQELAATTLESVLGALRRWRRSDSMV